MKLRVLTVLLSILLTPAIADALAVYKWRNADGSIVYSDKPPTSEELEEQAGSVEKSDVSSDTNVGAGKAISPCEGSSRACSGVAH